MSTRKIKNAVNNTTGELIYFKGHAQATYMSDGSTVEDAIKNIKPDLSDYVKSEELEGYAKTSDIPSLEGYAKEEDIPSLDGYAKTEDIPSLDGYVQSSELPNFDEFAKTNDIPSTEGLATEDFVTSQGYLTEIPDEYITNTELNSKGYATKTELNSLDFDHINNTPFTNDENGELNIVDEQGNVGLKLDGECLYVKDVVAGEHTLSNKADTSYVDEAIAGIVDGAPETLDTLNELSAALKDNADIVDVLNQSIISKQDVLVSGTNIKTINGESILGEGNISVSSMSVREFISFEPEYELSHYSAIFAGNTAIKPNKVYVCTESVGVFQIYDIEESNSIGDEYVIMFTASKDMSIEFVDFEGEVYWSNGVVPTINSGDLCELSIVRIGNKFKAVLSTFKSV